MKKTAALISFLAIGLSFQAQANEDKVVQSFFCKSNSISMEIAKYESGTVSWVVTNAVIGESEEFMGFVGAESADEFYSTDLGSDLHYQAGQALVTLTRFGDHRYLLKCTQN